MSPKILSQKKLIITARLLKKQGKKIVLVNGSFDIMHAGHVKFLNEAKRHGDVLLVLVNSDESIRQYKGPNRPIIKERERAEVVAAISVVDYVTLFDELQPRDIITRVRPDIYCNGSDWGRYCVEREAVESGGGQVVIINRKKSEATTSEIIKQILGVYAKLQVKAIFIDRDGTINDNRDGYVHRIADFDYLPGALKALRLLSRTDYKIIIVTNQSGIGRGYYTQKAYDKLMKFMLADFRQKKIRIDKVYFCPHHPADRCDCRKPKVGLLLKAVRDFGVSLNDSWLIGDDDCDVVMGREANVKTIKIGPLNSKLKVRPNFVASDLAAAAKIILNKQ